MMLNAHDIAGRSFDTWPDGLSRQTPNLPTGARRCDAKHPLVPAVFGTT
jgi:hypothetical protein